MRIFAGVPWKGGVIQQWCNRKCVFSGFRTLRIRHLRKRGQHYYIYYLAPCRLSTDPKMRDLEWLWMAWRAILLYMFSITNCHWLIICYLFTVLCLLHVWPTPEPCDQRRSAGSGVAKSDPQNIWNPPVTSVRLWQREFDLACPKLSKLSLILILLSRETTNKFV